LIFGGNGIETAGRCKSGIGCEQAEQALFSNQESPGTSKGSPGRTNAVKLELPTVAQERTSHWLDHQLWPMGVC